MPQFSSRRKRNPTIAAFGLVMLASLCLAACGSSSNSSSTSTGTNASSTTSTTSTTAKAKGAAGASRFAALRDCLQKNGITLPKRPTGTKPSTGGKRPPAGGFLGGSATGGPKLPAGVTRAKYEAAIKKCGGFSGRGGFAGGAATRFSSPTAKKALAKFAACLRSNGINVPEPNTSGKGPIFNTKGLDTSSPKFAAAESKCRSDLQGAFGARPGAGAGGAPPAGSAG
jgi:hypothetical protein